MSRAGAGTAPEASPIGPLTDYMAAALSRPLPAEVVAKARRHVLCVPDRAAGSDVERSTADKASTGVDLRTHGQSVHDKPVCKQRIRRWSFLNGLAGSVEEHLGIKRSPSVQCAGEAVRMCEQLLPRLIPLVVHRQH